MRLLLRLSALENKKGRSACNVLAAQHDIGAMYLQGLDVPKNYLTAKGWFLKAVKVGSEEARASLSEVLRLFEQNEEAAKATEEKKNKSTSSRLKFL